MHFDWFALATMLMAIRKKTLGISITIAVFLLTAPIRIERPETGIKLLKHAIAASPRTPESLRLLKDQSGRKVVNVKHFGAKGDGLTNDTAAVQTAINKAQGGSSIYFPAGTYVVSNFRVDNRSGLSFVGEGNKSIIQQKTGAARITTFDGSSDITISELAFDANGIDSFGGVVFYSVSKVRIENTNFFDSKPKPLGSNDRYSYVFARGKSPSKDIQIIKNRINDLQLEVDHARKVIIDGNTVSRSVRTAGIGIFTINDDTIAEDYLITGNTVIDPIGAGFNVGIDPPTNRNCIFRRIRMANNQVIRTKTAGYGIRIGTPDKSIRTAGNVFEDIVVENNRITIEPTAPTPRQMIFANTSDAASIVFNRLIITGNEIQNRAPSSSGYAIELLRIQHSLVAGNVIRGVTNGISLAVDLLHNEVRDNVVDASGIAYRLAESLGGNKTYNNRIISDPKIQWKVYRMHAGDAVDKEPNSATSR